MKQQVVKEILECETYQEVNRYLKTGDWILLDSLVDTQLCFSKVDIPDREGKGIFHKVQPFDKVVTLYIIGKIK